MVAVFGEKDVRGEIWSSSRASTSFIPAIRCCLGRKWGIPLRAVAPREEGEFLIGGWLTGEFLRKFEYYMRSKGAKSAVDALVAFAFIFVLAGYVRSLKSETLP